MEKKPDYEVIVIGAGVGGIYQIKRLAHPDLHQPNDVAQAPNGDVYFTDPDFDGKLLAAQHYGACAAK